LLLSEEQFRSIRETLEVLSDPQELKGIMAGRKDIAARRVEDLESVLERLQG
jgi:PHD/YefM family antitoxin component YafN of YafNO toxin-antitoxin module